jgi:serine/threonine-protein kinase RsbW
VATAYRTASGTTVHVRSFPGQTRQVGAARQFVGQALAGCPARDRLLTCVSELAANAIEHTESGAGGEFSVAVAWPRDGIAFVAVMDAGGPEKPTGGRSGSDSLAESGRGLALVAAYSSRWGYRDTARGRTVWAEATWPVPVRGGGGARRGPRNMWEDTWTKLVVPLGVA